MGVVDTTVGVVVAAGVSHAASSASAATETKNRMAATMPPPAPGRNACHTAAPALKRLNFPRIL